MSAPRVRELLGRPRFQPDVKRRTTEAGVATGLAWTPVGGDVLFIEATAMPGKGKLTITGQLGDVMKESAQAALSYVRGHSPELPEDWFATHDIHIHVPAGAIPKDGPCAGITMATALMSLVTGRPVRDDVAMTGELTLTGQVLPIGGLKEKALAAQRAGVKRVLAPVAQRGRPRGHPRGAALRAGLRVGERDRRCVRRRTRKWPSRVCSAQRSNLEPRSEARSDGEQEGAEGREGGSNGPLQPVRPAAHRRRGPASEHRAGLRVGARRVRAAEQRQEPGEADLRGQEAAEAHQGDRGQRPRRQRRRSTRRPRRARAVAAVSAASCCSASSAARWRWRCPRACARRCSTRCSAPRRSSSTPRPPRPRQHPGGHGRLDEEGPGPFRSLRAGAGSAPALVTVLGMALDVFGLCLGGNVFGWTADRDASFAVLDAYVEAGGNFIDTADTYMRPNMGISETIIGEWMAARGNRDSLVIATKVGSDGGLSAANIAAHVDGSLAAAADRADRPLLRPQGRRFGAGRGDRARVRQTVRDGKVREVAASNVPPERLVESLELVRARGAGGLHLAAAALQPRRARRLRARLRADRRRSTVCRSRRTTRSRAVS